MSNTISTLEELCGSVQQQYGAETELHGMAFIMWNADNSVGVAYSGAELQPLQIVDLSLNGARALVSMISSNMSQGTPEVASEAPQKEPLRVISDESSE